MSRRWARACRSWRSATWLRFRRHARADDATIAQAGMRNQCLNMRFYGSAMLFPHIQGAFRELLNCDAAQCVLAAGLTSGEAALAEPFSVVLHAARQAGDLMGARVLVTGWGRSARWPSPRRAGLARSRSSQPISPTLHWTLPAGSAPTAPSMSVRTPRLSIPTCRTRAISMRCSNAPARRPPWRKASRSCGRARWWCRSALAAT